MNTNTLQSKKGLLALGVLVIAVLVISRMVQHPANFAPLGAIALLSAFYTKSKWSLLIPLTALAVSDLFLGLYHWQVMAAVYGSYAIIWGLGAYARSQQTRWALLPSVLFASIIHFLLTNFAVWAFTGLYELSASGLALSYAMGIPFFKWTLAGDVFYSALFIAIIEGAGFLAKQFARSQALESN